MLIFAGLSMTTSPSCRKDLNAQPVPDSLLTMRKPAPNAREIDFHFNKKDKPVLPTPAITSPGLNNTQHMLNAYMARMRRLDRFQSNTRIIMNSTKDTAIVVHKSTPYDRMPGFIGPTAY